MFSRLPPENKKFQLNIALQFVTQDNQGRLLIVICTCISIAISLKVLFWRRRSLLLEFSMILNGPSLDG